jgi:tellurite resistance protein
MKNEVRIDLLARVARSAAPLDPARPMSILSLAAASYGSRPTEDATVPTGFDPGAVVLFEAIVEGAYLVATADGIFDVEEQRVFQRIVVAACGGTVAPHQVGALISDLHDLLEEDGLDGRIERLATTVTKRDHALEVLRIAGLLGQASNDVSKVEREVLCKIAKKCGLDHTAVDKALEEVRVALSTA